MLKIAKLFFITEFLWTLKIPTKNIFNLKSAFITHLFFRVQTLRLNVIYAQAYIPILLHKVSVMKLLHCNSAIIVYHLQDLTFSVVQICRYFILLAVNNGLILFCLQALLISIILFTNILNCVLIDRNIRVFTQWT